jgi:hypothetical protein
MMMSEVDAGRRALTSVKGVCSAWPDHAPAGL